MADQSTRDISMADLPEMMGDLSVSDEPVVSMADQSAGDISMAGLPGDLSVSDEPAVPMAEPSVTMGNPPVSDELAVPMADLPTVARIMRLLMFWIRWVVFISGTVLIY
jgi:hypothetical protein